MIYRQKTGTNFTIVNNDYLQNQLLSFKAKGLLTYLLSLPNDWKIQVIDLMNRSKDGRDSVMSGLNELIEFNYCIRLRSRDKSGKFESYDYVVSDVRLLHPQTGNPITEDQLTDNPQLINTNIKLKTNGTKEGIKPTKKPRKVSVLFIDSKCNKFEYFKTQLSEQFGDNVNYEYYYQKAKSWSSAKNKKSFDWIEEIKLWIMQDLGQNIKKQQSDVNEIETLKSYLSE